MEQIHHPDQLIPNEYYVIKMMYGLKLRTRFLKRRVIQDVVVSQTRYRTTTLFYDMSVFNRVDTLFDVQYNHIPTQDLTFYKYIIEPLRDMDIVFIKVDWLSSFGKTEIFRSRLYDILIKHILLRHLSCAHSHVSALIREFI